MQNSFESSAMPSTFSSYLLSDEKQVDSAFQPKLAKINLLDLNQQGIEKLLISWGEKPMWAQSILKWIHQHGIYDFSNMHGLSRSLQQRLLEECEISAPEISKEYISKDGTRKWLMRLADGNHIETVFIPERNRGTLCVSSQVGCILNCRFCSTATQGFNRNLTVSEIIGQVWQAARYLKSISSDEVQKLSITNVVMMGMGEPLLNFEALIIALSIMRNDVAYALPRRRVTVSTSGVVPNIDKLNQMADVSLAVSLHAANDSLRDHLVPLNKKYPLALLLKACHRYAFARPNRHIIMEYVMLKEINDSLFHAEQLIQILQGIPCKINLIPFNPFPHTRYERSSAEAIRVFKHALAKAGFITTVRKTRGEDVTAACGQLVGRIQDRTKRNQRFKEQSNG